MNRIYKKLQALRNLYSVRFFLNKAESEFFEKTRKNIILPETSTKLKLFLQMPEDYFYVIAFNKLLNQLKTEYQIEINWININSDYTNSGKAFWLSLVPFYDRKWTKLYLCNGGNSRLKFTTNLFKKIKFYKKSKKIFNSLTCKQDVLNIEIDGIKIGDLIYDTYLRYSSSPTLNIRDPFLIKLIIAALHIFEITKKSFESERPNILFTSYSSYVHHGIPVRLALKYGIKVISLGSYELLTKTIDNLFPTHIKDYTNYKNEFLKLDQSTKAELISKSQLALENRFKGVIDAATFYMKSSAFSDQSTTERFLPENGKKNIVVYAHCFFDSPHVRRWMLFEDFYEWLDQTFQNANYEKYNYFIKYHPNARPGNLEVIQHFLHQFPKVNLIPVNITTNQLIKEGIHCGVTMHGTVGHELPYFNIPIINAADNPHIDFSFSYTAKTKDEYFKLIQNIELIPVINEEAKNEILQFYGMHNIYTSLSDPSIDDNNFINGQIRFLETDLDVKNYWEKEKEESYNLRIQSIFKKSLKSHL